MTCEGISSSEKEKQELTEKKYFHANLNGILLCTNLTLLYLFYVLVSHIIVPSVPLITRTFKVSITGMRLLHF